MTENGGLDSRRVQFCPQGHDTFLEGRDTSGRCLRCKREAMRAARQASLAEEQAIRQAEHALRRAEEEKRRKAERARIIKAGGPAAIEERWHEARERSSRHNLCQWAQSENLKLGGCFEVAENMSIYCAKHTREVEERRIAFHRKNGTDPYPRGAVIPEWYKP